MAHFIGIKQPNGQISPVMDFENTKPVKLSLMPAREGQDKVLIPFYYVDTEHSEYTIPLGSYTVNYKKKPSLKQDSLALHLTITNKGKLKVILAAPGGKAKIFHVFKHLKKKQRSQKVKPSPKPAQQPGEGLSPEGFPSAGGQAAGVDGMAAGAPNGMAAAAAAAGTPAGGRIGGFKLVLIIVYALILSALVFFLLTQTFDALSLEKLFGISL
jgi:hypothetical protein